MIRLVGGEFSKDDASGQGELMKGSQMPME